MDDPQLRKALFEFDAGKGPVLLHPGWHNRPDWPEYTESSPGGAKSTIDTASSRLW
jgi:hypothetical protein